MKTRISSALISLTFIGLLAGCGGGGGGGGVSPPPSSSPPPAAMSAAGIWAGEAVTPDVASIVTGFEFNDTNGFILGTAPFTANFMGGITETRGIGALYKDGAFSWHVSSAGASITFAVPGDSLSLWTRTVTAGDTATIKVLDEDDVELSSTFVPDNNFLNIVMNRNPGQSLIGSVVITVAAGDEIVIDAFSFGFPSTASSEDIGCLFSPNDEFICVITDALGLPLAGANGTYSVNGDQVTGAGNLYAGFGEMLVDGSTIAPLTISGGSVVENTTLNLTITSTGLSTAVTSLFSDTYDRVGDLSVVEAVYSTYFLYGEMTSFAIDANGIISGQTASGCMLSGQVSVIDPAVNMYDVSLVADAATCGMFSGNYSGLGTSQDDTVMDDSFVFAVFVDGQLMIAGVAIK